MAGVKGQCPQCGAPLTFGGAHSIAAICSYCRSSIARHGADLENLGKVPDLVATDTRLALMVSGRLGSKAFTIIGHLQLDHPGGGTWDEWYASFADGTWGWLAEAQGRLYVSRPLRGIPDVPRLTALWAGKSITIPGAGTMTVDEVNEARFASAEGELPFAPRVGATYRYADASGQGAVFVTLDYGDEGERAEVFAGRELAYQDVGLADRAPLPTAGKEKGVAIACPNCGGSLSLRMDRSQSATCPSCHSLLDVSKGSARLLQELQRRGAPAIPLGSKGTLRGDQLELLGWVRRSCEVEGVTYDWEEYLLHGKAGYRWLSESNGHFAYLVPIHAGKVSGVNEGSSATCDGRHFRHFQSAEARYEAIQGEFYWKLDVSQSVHTADYVAPPYLLSCEMDGNEVNWTRGEYVPADEVWRSFGLPGKPPAQGGTPAPCQPNPSAVKAGRAWTVSGIALAAIVLVSVILSAVPRRQVAQVTVPLAPALPTRSPFGTSPLTPQPVSSPGTSQPPAEGAPGEPPQSAVVLTEPFEVTGGPQAIEISAGADVDQAWVGLDVALINDESGEVDQVGFELSRYSDVEDGERWSEGSNTGSATISSVPDGRYVLRVEPQLERGMGAVGTTATVAVVRGVFLVQPLLLALFLVTIWPILLTIAAASFEKRRWAESDHGPQ